MKTIADAPDVLNTNDKAMWVLGYNQAHDEFTDLLRRIVEYADDSFGPTHSNLISDELIEEARKVIAGKHDTGLTERWRKELRACVVELLYIAHNSASPSACKKNPRYADVMRLIDNPP